jgi:hypothetical protein
MTQKDLAQLRVTGHISANEPGEFSASAELGQHFPLCEDLTQLLGAVDRCHRRAVSHQVRVAVRNNDDVVGLQGHGAAVLLDPGVPPSFGDQVIDDDVLGACGEI